MKKVAALFFLLVLIFLTIPNNSKVIPTFKEDNQFDIYEIEVKNDITIDQIYDTFKNSDIDILKLIDKQDRGYIFKNYKLETNIEEFKKNYEYQNIFIKQLFVYTTKTKLDKFLNLNNFLYSI